MWQDFSICQMEPEKRSACRIASARVGLVMGVGEKHSVCRKTVERETYLFGMKSQRGRNLNGMWQTSAERRYMQVIRREEIAGEAPFAKWIATGNSIW